MRKRLLLLCLLGLMPVALRAQSASGGGKVSGGGSIMAPAAPSHSVTLTWTASTTSGVTGYNVYRSTTTGGPYTKLTSTAVTGTSYTDSSVTAGSTYYYVATALVGTSESGYSTQASATVPTP
ncbi:MAG TPA: fibronectin type III domain-containing protein [Terriglobia bacterium]|nr:fibronectin type III domain-containing protein [Terriglobia bacterium]